MLEGAHAAGTGSLSALSFLAPLIRAQLRCRVTALGTGLVLPVECTDTTTPAERVGLGVSLTEG